MPAGVLVESVEPRTPADRSGLRGGDRLIRVNSRKVDDHLDIQFHAASGEVLLEIVRGGAPVSIVIPEEEHPLRGVAFEEFRSRLCGSKCLFCFVDQLPPDVRPTLKVKDEDFRLSFLHGNYITLGTLKDRELERILEQRLSPLYVSIHAVQEDVRNKLLGRPPKRPLLPTMERLMGGGIELYGQIVLCPGINDGPVLAESMEVLSQYHPRLRAVAVVPLGLSAHRRADGLLQEVTPEIAGQVLDQIGLFQNEFLKKKGTRFLFPGDEFFLRAAREIPPADYYEEFDQIEDGIGMIRSFAETFREEYQLLRSRTPAMKGLALITGGLFHKELDSLLEPLRLEHQIDLRVIGVENDYLGRSITVAGLLAGQDVAAAIRERGEGYPVALPSEMVSGANGLLLDNYSPEQVAKEGEVENLHVVNGAEELLRLIWDGKCGCDYSGTYPHT